MEVGGGVYTYRYTVTTWMTYALRWAAMTAILMFHNCEGQGHKTLSTDHNFWRERRAEAHSNGGPFAYQPNALPLGQTTHREWTAAQNQWHSLFTSFLTHDTEYRTALNMVLNEPPDFMSNTSGKIVRRETTRCNTTKLNRPGIWNRTTPRALVQNQHTRELISARNT